MPGRDPVEMEGPAWPSKGGIDGRGDAKHVRPRAVSESPLCTLKPEDPVGQAGRRRMSRSESVASRDLPKPRNRRLVVAFREAEVGLSFKIISN